MVTKSDKLELFVSGIEINNKLPKYKKGKSDLYKPIIKDGALIIPYENPKIEEENVINPNDTDVNQRSRVGFSLNPILDGSDDDDDVYDKYSHLMSLATKWFHSGNTFKIMAGSFIIGLVRNKYEARFDNKGKLIKPEYTIDTFFNTIKGALNSDDFGGEEYLTTMRDHYVNFIESLKITGQQALIEKSTDLYTIKVMENILRINGVSKYITESQLVECAKKSERGLALTYVKNFTRVIPNDIIKRIDKLNKLYIFDNYVILHYDPKGKSSELTKEEIEKKKDPIIFGLIKGKEDGEIRLYYVGDWVDEYCNLTLDKLISTTGVKPKKTKKI